MSDPDHEKGLRIHHACQEKELRTLYPSHAKGLRMHYLGHEKGPLQQERTETCNLCHEKELGTPDPGHGEVLRTHDDMGIEIKLRMRYPVHEKGLKTTYPCLRRD